MNTPARYPDATLSRLFAHVLINDVVTLAAPAPASFPVRFSQHEIAEAYRLAYELFDRRADLAGLRRLSLAAMRTGDVPEGARLPFKHVRALFKQVRFANANFDRRHRYPRGLTTITVALGYLQDSFKNGRHAQARLQAAGVRALLTAPALILPRHELRDFQPATPAGLATWMDAENRRLAEVLAKPAVTARQFHSLRKIVSRRVSLYDTLRAVTPSAELDQVSLFLATLNGLMGAMHDRLVEERFVGTSDYDKDLFAIPADIHDRLAAFAARSERT